MHETITIDLKALAELIFENGLRLEIIEENVEILGCPNEVDYLDIIDNYVASKTPMGYIIMEGALTQLYQDLHSFIIEESYYKFKLLLEIIDDETQDLLNNNEQDYEIEADQWN